MFYAIDRFEDIIAILEDDNGKSIPVPREQLPQNAKQGDVFSLENGSYVPAPEETARRQKYVRKLQERLIKKNP